MMSAAEVREQAQDTRQQLQGVRTALQKHPDNEELRQCETQLQEALDVMEDTLHSLTADVDGDGDGDGGVQEISDVCEANISVDGGPAWHQVRVLHQEQDGAVWRCMPRQPLSAGMRPCSFFLDGDCKRGTSCRFSHGYAVPASLLRPVRTWAPEVGDACLAVFSDGLWYRAEVHKVCDDDDTAEVVFRGYESDGGVRVGIGETAPAPEALHTPRRQPSVPEKEAPSSAAAPAFHAAPQGFCDWAQSTSGLGLRYLKKYGYKFGSGLGKHSEGRVEPVPVQVRKRNVGLEFDKQDKACAQPGTGKSARRRQRKRERERAEDAEKRPWLELQEEKAQQNTFDFLNTTLGSHAPATTPSPPPPSSSSLKKVDVMQSHTHVLDWEAKVRELQQAHRHSGSQNTLKQLQQAQATLTTVRARHQHAHHEKHRQKREERSWKW